ncbi:MAG: DUF6629 family protein [Bacteroidia bacterium]
MCFSAEASFGASALLGTIGVFCYKKASTSPQKMLAFFPLLFSFQQFAEGMLWISIENNMLLIGSIAKYIFIIIALAVWPLIVPLTVYRLEQSGTRKKMLLPILLVGSFTCLYLGVCIAVLDFRAEIDCYHINYVMNFPFANPLTVAIFYVVPVLLSLLMSSVKKLPLLGILAAISIIVAMVFYTKYAISVWCFFSAIMSSEILLVIYRMNDQSQNIAKKS